MPAIARAAGTSCHLVIGDDHGAGAGHDGLGQTGQVGDDRPPAARLHEAAGGVDLGAHRAAGEVALGDVLAQMNLHSTLSEIVDAPVLIGGPVQPERGFVLHTPGGDWESSFHISERVSVTTSRDILVAMAEGNGPRHAIVALGYSGWSPGQLEQELVDNHWLTAPADEALLFETPLDERWQAAAHLVGVNLFQLASHAGHA